MASEFFAYSMMILQCFIVNNGLYDYNHNAFDLRHPVSSDTDSDLCYAVPLTSAAKNNGALCLDGSVPRYYFRNGTESSKFQIYFQGGSWCAGIGEQVNVFQTCYGRSYSYLGSTNTSYDNNTLVINNEYMSTSCEWNTLMCDWNLVYIRYCDGTSFTSNVDNITYYHHKPLYFRGFRIIEAVIDDLIKNKYLLSATDVVVSGSSAGALSVYLHIDYIKNRLSSNTKVRGLSDSGFFIDYQTDNSDNFTVGMEWIFDNMNSSYSLNKQCLNKYNETNEEYQCIFAQYNAPYISTPILALQSQFDSYQIEDILDVEYNNDEQIQIYGNNLTSIFNETYLLIENNIHAAILDSCCHHTDQWNQIIINGLDQNQILNLWYNDQINQTFWFQNHTYPCNNCCKNGHTCN
eukprot:294839_1